MCFFRIDDDLKRANCDTTQTKKQQKACLYERDVLYLHSADKDIRFVSNFVSDLINSVYLLAFNRGECLDD